MALDLVSDDRNIEVCAVRISGQAEDISPLIAIINGKITAYYSGKKLNDERRNSAERSALARKGLLNLVFCADPDRTSELQRLELSAKRLYHQGLIVNRIEDGVDNNALRLITEAERIDIKNFLYADNDVEKNLIHEGCEIIHPAGQPYIWDYTIRAANRKPLPASVVEHIESIFDIVKDRFSEDSFAHCRLSDMEGVNDER